jgi:acylphosphatase
MGQDPAVRCDVIFRGQVQGVGFRYTTNIVAKSFPVTGYVMNLRDGTVRLVAEGTRASVSKLIQRVEGELGSYITDKNATWGRATGEFPAFGVRHEGP